MASVSQINEGPRLKLLLRARSALQSRLSSKLLVFSSRGEAWLYSAWQQYGDRRIIAILASILLFLFDGFRLILAWRGQSPSRGALRNRFAVQIIFFLLSVLSVFVSWSQRMNSKRVLSQSIFTTLSALRVTRFIFITYNCARDTDLGTIFCTGKPTSVLKYFPLKITSTCSCALQ